MSETLSAGLFSPANPPPDGRAVFRLANDFLVSAIEANCKFMAGDFLQALVWNAIWLANVGELAESDPDNAYGKLEALAPDALRKPVNRIALAHALDMPRETVRRYTNALVRSGMCEQVGRKGLRVPAAVFDTPQQIAMGRDAVQSVGRFVEKLQHIGLASDVAVRRNSRAGGEPPANFRAVLRAHAKFSLRALADFRKIHNHHLATVVYMAICAADTRSSDAQEGARAPIEDRGHPVTSLGLSKALHIPRETMRRVIKRFVHSGVCTRLAGHGIVVNRAAQRRIETAAVVAAVHAQVTDFLSDLQRIGFVPSGETRHRHDA